MKNIRLCLFMYVSIFISTGTLYGVESQSDLFCPTVEQLLAIVRTELKKAEYARDILPHDFTYFNQLLVHGREMHSRQDYARSVCTIFSKVLGGSQYVNAYAFEQLLDALPQTLKPYFVSCKAYSEFQPSASFNGDMFDRFKEAVSHTLYVQFSSQYDVFKTSPLQFFDELSLYIADIAQQEMDTQHLRTAVKRFLELGMSKLVWSHEEHTKIWGNVKSIAHSLSLLMDRHIIEDQSDLDDMYWTLIHRFNYFLDLVAVEMPYTFYQEIKEDIMQDNLLLLTLQEQDTCIQTKRECLTYAVLEAEAKSRAYEKGILVS